MGLILDISPRTLERVLYFASYIVLDKGETDLSYKQILSEAEYQEAKEKWGRHAFRVGMGAESIKELLESIDLEKEYAELQAENRKTSGSCRSIPRVRKQTGVDDPYSYPGYPAGSASYGTAGWRTFCNI